MAFRRLTVSLRTRSRLFILLALSVGCTAVSAVYFIRNLARPGTGLVEVYPETVIRGGKVVFSPRTPFSIAEAAGLEPERDELVSVNGIPVNSTLDVLTASSGIGSFDAFPVVVRRDGGETLSIPITPAFALSRIDWFLLLLCAVALAYAAFTLSIAMSGEPFCAPLVLASLSLLVFVCVRPFSCQSAAANALAQLGGLFPWLLLLSALSFPSPKLRRGARAAVGAAILLPVIAFAGARVSLISRWLTSGAEHLLERYDLLGRISSGLDAAAYAAFILVLAHTYVRTRDGVVRKQVPWMLAGALIALPPVFFFEELPPLLGNSPTLRIGLGPFMDMFLLAVPVFVLIGLTQNRLLNLKRFLSRYAVYAAMLLLMFAFFSFAYIPLRDFLRSGYRLSQPMGDFFAAGALFIMLMTLGFWLASAADKALFSARHRGSPLYVSELEARNTELSLELEKVNAGYERAVRGEKLAELRLILKGITARLQEPFERMLSALSSLESRGAFRGELSGSIEAGVRASEIFRGVRSHSARTISMPSIANIDVIVRSAVESVRRKHRSARFELSPGTSAGIFCCPEEMVDAVSFVLENAVEAQDGFGAPIPVRTISSVSNVTVEIEDAGAGISDSDWRNLFRPFFTTKPGHLGLGLYFARLITQRNGGSLVMAPGSSCGTRACFVFPGAPGGRRSGEAEHGENGGGSGG